MKMKMAIGQAGAIRQATSEVDLAPFDGGWQVMSLCPVRKAWMVGPVIPYRAARMAVTVERAMRAVQSLYPQEDRLDVAYIAQRRAYEGGTLREIVRDAVKEFEG